MSINQLETNYEDSLLEQTGTHGGSTPVRILILKNEEESARLAIRRDTLLPRLMSGELKVTNMDLVNEMLEKGIR